jgi:DNA-binding MarR family transcriptional regulator
MDDERLERTITTFSRAVRLMDAVRLHVWDERGLTLPQLRILFRIRDQPGIGVREMAQAFGVSASNISQQVDKLVSRGWVTRTDRVEDRRQVANTLTEEGQVVASEVSQAGRAYLRGVLGHLSPEEQSALTALLTHVVAAASEAATPAAVARAKVPAPPQA